MRCWDGGHHLKSVLNVERPELPAGSTRSIVITLAGRERTLEILFHDEPALVIIGIIRLIHVTITGKMLQYSSSERSVEFLNYNHNREWSSLMRGYRGLP
jgi:hypothetical protein